MREPFPPFHRRIPESEMTATINVNTLASPSSRSWWQSTYHSGVPMPFSSMTSHIKILNCRTVLIKEVVDERGPPSRPRSLTAPIISEPETGFLSAIDQSFYLGRREHYYRQNNGKGARILFIKGDGEMGQDDPIGFIPCKCWKYLTKGNRRSGCDCGQGE